MAKWQKTPGARIFRLSLLVYAVLLTAAAVWALRLVWRYAEEYEASRPEKTIRTYVTSLSLNFWDANVAQTVSRMPHELQTDQDVRQVVEEMLRDQLTYSRTTGGSGESLVYSLRCGGRAFGRVELVQDRSHAAELRFGLYPWVVAWAEFDFSALYVPVEIMAPASYSVRLNGHELGEEYVIARDIGYDVLSDYYGRASGLPTKVTYRVENVIGPLEPELYDSEGTLVRPDEDGDDSQFFRPVCEEDWARFESFAWNFTDRYRQYIAGVYGQYNGYQSLAPYLQQGSDLDRRLRSAASGAAWTHSSAVTLDSLTLNSVYDLENGSYLLDIRSVSTAVQPKDGVQTEVQYIQSMRLYVSAQGNDIRVIFLDVYENSEA